MRSLVLSILVISISLCVAEPSQEEDDPYLYDQETFEEAVEEGPHFVMFFAPWCGHCKNLKPAWKELADYYHEVKNDAIKIVKVDCTLETELCSDHGVTGYPTLKLFSPGKEPVRYRGGRDLEFLKNFVEENLALVEKQEPDVEVNEGLYELTADNFEGHVAEGYHLVKFFAPWCGHCKRLEPVWKELALKYQEGDIVKIGRVDCTQHQDVCKSHEVKGYPTLLWFKDGEKEEKYQGGRQLESFLEYITKMTGKAAPGAEEPGKEKEGDAERPEVAEGLHELSDNSFDLVIATGDVFVKFFAPWCGHCKRMEPAWKELAKEYKNHPKVKIARVDCTKHSSVCQSNEVKGYPTLKYYRDGAAVDNKPMGREIENLKSFVKVMLKEGGQAKEEVPQKVEEPQQQVEEAEEEPQVVDGLYELTAENYDDLTSTGDFFIKFFAPWCGHCKKMEPAWKELAKAYESDSKVKIGRVDCTKHSSVCTGKGVRGYPTLKYFRNGDALDDSPAGRDINSLKSFVVKMSQAEEEPQQQEEEEEEPQQEEEKEPEGPEIVEGLYELTEGNFDDLTAEGDFFVKFFAPWCGHCRSMEGAWKELAKDYEGNSNIKIGRVDCTKHRDVCKSKSVRGYPTLKYFRKGQELEGSPPGRDIDSLKSFVMRMSKKSEEEEVEQEQEQVEEDEEDEPEVVEGLYELTEDNFDELTASGDFFIKFFAPWCGHCKAMEPAWKELAKVYKSHPKVKIARVDCTKYQSVCKSSGTRGYPTLKYFRNGEALTGSPDGRDIDNLKLFVEEKLEAGRYEEEEKAKVGGAPSVDADTFKSTIETGMTFVMFYAPWCGHCKKLAPTWDELAEEEFSDVKVPVHIIRVDCVKYEDLCEEQKVEGYPTLKLYVDGKHHVKYTEKRDLLDLEAFVVERAYALGYGETEEDVEAKKDEL